MDEELHKRTMKLLADPHKLIQSKTREPEIDRFRSCLETTYDYKLSESGYTRMKQLIHNELILDSIVQDIINQVSLSHSP